VKSFDSYGNASAWSAVGSFAAIAPSSAKAITAFSFTSPAATGTIDETGKTILMNLPSGTNVTSLVATFTTTGKSVTVGSTVQVSGVTQVDFTSPVTYTVNAADGSTQNYTVTVIAGALPAQWAQSVTAGSSYSFFNSVSVASDGSVYAAGFINGTGTYNFGNSITSAGTSTVYNIVLVKYDSSGAAQWARTVTTGSTYSDFNSVSVASDGSVYAVGYIYGTGTYGFGNSITSAGTSTGYNIVLVKYNSSGAAQWAQTVTAGSSSSWFNGVSVASDGSVYAAGSIYGTVTYNFGNNVKAAGTFSNYNIVLVKYNSSGVAQWAQTVTTGSSSSYFNSVSVAADGSVYAAGYIYGTGYYGFGNSVNTAGTYGYNNIVLVKYNSSGTAQWAQTVTAGSSYSSFSSVSVASDGSVYAAGYIYGTGTFNFGNSVTAAGLSNTVNSVLVKYNSSGMAQWAQTATAGSGYSQFISVSATTDGSAYAAGYIYGTGTYDFGNSVTATGTYVGNNIVLVKYNSSGVAQWAQTVTVGSSDSNFSSVSVASDGSVFAVGNVSGTSTYNFGNSVTATGTYSSANIVLVKYY
jgi:outer membrane protein assembly factor BamB